MIICYALDCEYCVPDKDTENFQNTICTKEVVTITDGLICEDYSKKEIKEED